jgi:hypothetical protein
LFNKVNERQFIQLEKELISLDLHSFEKIEEYLARVKEIHLKLGECGKNYQNKDDKCIELVPMNLRTPFDVFIFKFKTNWKECKEDGKDYTFDSFSRLLINDQHIFLNEGKLGEKHQAHLLKEKDKVNNKEIGKFNTPIQRT